MMKFFRNLVKTKATINQDVLIEAKNAFEEIRVLQKSNNMHELEHALYLLNEAEKKYPFCFDTARYYRGEIASMLVNNEEFIKQNLKRIIK